jgi:hypothetical protein
VPFGDNLIAATETSSGASHQSNLIAGGLPLTFDAGYRVIPSVYVGAFFTYSGLVHPWIGLGFGYQWTAVDLSSNAQSGSAVYSGFQFVNLQLGLDLKAATRVGLGPFVTLGLGQYDHVSTSFGGQTASSDVANTGLHGWLTFGVRAVYDFAR